MYRLPSLPYAYDALSSVISQEIMELHHQKHHQGYVDKLNVALEQAPELAEKSIVDLLGEIDTLPESIRQQVRNQGGGHYNHSLFWEIMSPQAATQPSGEIAQKIDEAWGSFDAFKQEFNDKATKLFGSGWVWLTRDFEIIAQSNQDNPIMIGKGEPIMGLDVWEHAYYLDYRNKRDEYIENWWQIVDWASIERRYQGK